MNDTTWWSFEENIYGMGKKGKIVDSKKRRNRTLNLEENKIYNS